MTQQKLVHFFLKKIYFDIFKYTNRMKTTSFSTKKYFLTVSSASIEFTIGTF
ncbi:unnamed protein product [Acanthoscelides obtectus]|uniref:Uncharacterized protein n=1 Tax=Acanthoscelides obtectus TaxID=200917 RepID=A0A9P0K7H8_ACAOB|nr:unnamed protein product [Acanthoscelides obtectus]CAK1648388.1 hypothetical protein AOBTE_LOCUS15698 [Acanthoscelides obtectus]